MISLFYKSIHHHIEKKHDMPFLLCPHIFGFVRCVLGKFRFFDTKSSLKTK